MTNDNRGDQAGILGPTREDKKNDEITMQLKNNALLKKHELEKKTCTLTTGCCRFMYTITIKLLIMCIMPVGT